MRCKFPLIPLLVIAFILIPRAFSYSISGYVFNGKTGEAIPGVNVLVKNTQKGASTDLNGFFIISDLKPGKYTLIFSHIAFQKKELETGYLAGDLYLGRIELLPGVIQSQAVTVTARRSELIEQEPDDDLF